ncbi:lipocalin-like domain-containing protein, partial [Ideonella sp.]|uniref:lipocalin-like domain-containing protein n=1 Tax=Ideonella sp. TaxID=1929293 RepID=UPI003BB50E1D
MHRRALPAALWGLLGSAGAGDLDRLAADPVRLGRPLRFPRDHGAHPGAQIEWWYATGQLQAGPLPAGNPPVAAPRWGFQITFFRTRTGLAEALPGRFAPRQLLFAHAALTDLGAAGQVAAHRHDQRIARWDGQSQAAIAHARLDDTGVALGNWRLAREGGPGRYRAALAADGFALQLDLQPRQPVLLQGEAGYSRKGPERAGPGSGPASHYYSLPQLQVQGTLQAGQGSGPALSIAVHGQAWLDHEWSDSLLSPDAQGWDWLGINLFDGGALTLFQLRPREPAAGIVWAGGSHRSADGVLRVFGPETLRFEPGRRWRSGTTGADYPVEWVLHTPAGRFTARALLDAQELDSRGGTGTVYWEGLTELRDERGQRCGLGYLE